jgi:dihydrofolate synthase/folylpolyglutamate synthase
MDFTLDRIGMVLDRLGIRPLNTPVITVGGTNGKGSVTALLESIVQAGGGRVGLYTSPHLLRYQERIRLNGQEVDEAVLVSAFERIEAARGDITLTYFEYATAAALLCFSEAPLDLIVLEVGLGGRFDAVNAIDADVAVIVSVSLDHCDYLGTTVEAIGREKAGICRPQRPVILGSEVMPASILSYAAELAAPVHRLGHEFTAHAAERGFHFVHGDVRLDDLPMPSLQGAAQMGNAATALAALQVLDLLPPPAAIAAGLTAVSLPGRYEVRPGPVRWIFDVAHNPGAARVLVATLQADPCQGRTIWVAGLLADKDAAAVMRELLALLQPDDVICAVSLTGERGRSAADLTAVWQTVYPTPMVMAESVSAGCAFAAQEARPGDRVVVFGSFHTVAPALDWHRLYLTAS